MTYQLIDYQSRMGVLKDGLSEHIQSYLADNEKIRRCWHSIEQIYCDKLTATKPEIMVYGIYNAGKSSIINELLGEERARVADVPTTDSVDYYDWNGYRIADTPGVAAPIEHEQVTQEHLKKADVVLFVMSTTGSNERRENYVRMKDIADAGKKIIIILNDKNAELLTPEGCAAIQEIKCKVAWNMKQAGIPDVDKKYFIVTVNAQMARSGRIKQKEVLREKSNIAELTSTIMHELKNTRPFDILGNAVYEVEENLGPVIKELEKYDTAQGMQGANKLLELLRTRIKEVRGEMSFFIDRKAGELGIDLPKVIWSHRSDSAKAEALVENMIEDTLKCVQAHLEAQVSSLIQELMEEAKYLQSKIECRIGNVQALQAEEMLSEAGGLEFQEVLDKLQETLQALDDIVQGKEDAAGGSGGADLTSAVSSAMAGQAAGEAASAAVGQLAKSSIGKAILKTTIGKLVLGPVLPVVGPLITIGSIVYGLFSLFGGGNNESTMMEARVRAANEQARRQQEAEEQAHQELVNKCRYRAADVADSLKSSISSALSGISGEIAKPFQEQRNKLADSSRRIQDDLESLRSLADKYDALRLELKTAEAC